MSLTRIPFRKSGTEGAKLSFSFLPFRETANTKTTMAEDYTLKVLRLLQENPHLSQREASDVLGLSLGKTNYVINALIEKGMIKIKNFKNNKNKSTYAYLLTPQGVEEKARLTMHFFEVKKLEYEELKGEVEKLAKEKAENSKHGPEFGFKV